MLILSRKKDQAIYIDGGIRLIVVEIRGDQVRFGIEAPPETKIWRSEIRPTQAEGDGKDAQ